MVHLIKRHKCNHSKLIKVDQRFMNTMEIKRYDNSDCELCGGKFLRINEVKNVEANIKLNNNIKEAA